MSPLFEAAMQQQQQQLLAYTLSLPIVYCCIIVPTPTTPFSLFSTLKIRRRRRWLYRICGSRKRA
jgi:hypothetical protein